MEKGVADTWLVKAINATSGSGVTGIGAAITNLLYKDGATSGASTTDVNPTELSGGFYQFNVTTAENDVVDQQVLVASHASAIMVAYPEVRYPRPKNFNAIGIESDGDVTKVNALDGNTPQTADHTPGIADIPTVSEFNARSLVSADYTIVADLGTVQTDDHTAVLADIPTVAEFNARTRPTVDYFDQTTDEVITDAASRTASKADVSGLAPAGEYDIELDATISSRGTADSGDEMDIINVPNAIAITAIQNGLATPTNITGGTITTVTNNTDMRGTDGANTVVPPSVAQSNARSIPSADYLIESDTLARVTLVDTVTDNTDLVTAAAVLAAMEANNTLLDYLATDLIYKKSITIASGNSIQYDKTDTLIGTIAIGYADDGTTVFRKNQTQVKV